MTATTTMVHVRVRKDVKDKAQKEAKKLGVSLSVVAEQAFRDFANTKRLVIEEEPLKPTPYLARILREAEKNKDNPDYWSGPFSGDAFVEHLRGLSRKAR